MKTLESPPSKPASEEPNRSSSTVGSARCLVGDPRSPLPYTLAAIGFALLAVGLFAASLFPGPDFFLAHWLGMDAWLTSEECAVVMVVALVLVASPSLLEVTVRWAPVVWRWLTRDHSTLREAKASRENNCDFLRFLLASVGVILFHSFGLLYGNADHDPLRQFTGQQIGSGGFAVGCFFFLSGYLILLSWTLKPKISAFFWKRFLRIYPAFLVASAFSLLVAAPVIARHLSVYRTLGWHDVLVALCLMPPADHGATAMLPVAGLNGSMWTISYEARCYILVAVLGILGVTRYRIAVLGLCALTYATLCAIHFGYIVLPNPEPFLIRDFWMGLGGYTMFLLGMTAFSYRERISLTWLGLVGAIAIFCLSVQHREVFLAAPITSAYLMLWLAFSDRLKMHRWATKRGDLSYGMYLFAFPVQQLLIRYAGAHLTAWTLFFLAFVLSYGAAKLSWRFIEAPALRLKSQSPLIYFVVLPVVKLSGGQRAVEQDELAEIVT